MGIFCNAMISTITLLYCLFLFYIHLKLELLTQFPALNDKKYAHVKKILKIQLFD